jgi:predicted esterase
MVKRVGGRAHARGAFVAPLVIAAIASPGAACSTTQAPEATTTAREPAASAGAASAASTTPDTATVTTTATSSGPVTGAGADGNALSPLTAEGELVPLAVAGFREAVVSVPLGATTPRPVVLALHGNFDRPEWQCDVWRGVTRARAFVLCPRGIPRPDAPRSLDRWTYGKGTDVRAEVEAALAALRARFEGYVAPSPLLYTGFSLGAIHGVGIVAGDGNRYPRAVLVEGGHDGWTAARAKSYAAAGGKRILFACGQRACKNAAAAAQKRLEREGIESKVVHGGEVGHTYDGPVAAEVTRAWSWLVGDDPRWSDLSATGESSPRLP